MKKMSFWVFLACTILMLSSCSNSDILTPTKPIETTKETVATETTAPKVHNEYELVDCYIDSLASVLGYEFTDIVPLDIHGEDYKTEFRTFSFKKAVGKKASIPGGVIEVVNYGSVGNKSIRIYAEIDSFDIASQLYESAVRLLDTSITDEEIKNQYNDSDLDVNIFLGTAGNITGYINKSYHDGGQTTYNLMIDCVSPTYQKMI